MAVYALLVGIDAYEDPVAPLRGAVRDVRLAQDVLYGLAHEDLHPLLLTDAAATRAAIIDGFRTHLSRARAGDAAVFWFSGHGSQVPVLPSFARLEPTGMMQTLVCADSRQGTVPDLLDKELGLLIAQVAASGAHVAAILDCCYGAGATRTSTIPDVHAWTRARQTPAGRQAPDLALLLPELSALASGADAGRPAGADMDMGLGAAADHVSLAACQAVQLAYEIPTDDGWRGVFSMMLLRNLAQPGLTYRELLARTRCSVETAVPGQWPALYPMLGDLADQPFLGGRVSLPPSSLTLRHRHGAWQVDAGACHGLTAGTEADPTLLGLYGDPLRRQVRVLRVEALHCVVEPVGWRLEDEDEHHPVVVTRVPLPATGVAVAATVVGLDDVRETKEDARADAASETPEPRGSGAARQGAATRASLIARQVARCGPGGVPSPFIRIVGAAGSADRAPVSISIPAHDHSRGSVPGPDLSRAAFADLLVTFPSPTTARVCGADGTPLAPAVAFAEPAHVRRLVLDLEHIARWRLIKTLQNPRSPLVGAVTLEIIEAFSDENAPPAARTPLRPDASGAVRIRSRRDLGGQATARMFMRLRNTADRRLYCVLLTLTDRFEMRPDLFPGWWVEPGRPAPVAAGAPIRLVLPPDRIAEAEAEAEGGVARTDWFTILAAEEPFGPEPFHLPALGAFGSRVAAPAMFSGLLDRLGAGLLDRDLTPAPPPAGNWATSTVTVVTLAPTV